MSEELPSGWTGARLAELAAFNPKHPANTPVATPVTFVPMAAVCESSPDLDTSQTRPFGEVRKGYTHFSDGDVLFAKITPCMENGKGGVASKLKNGLGCGTTELVVMRSQGGVDPLLLYRFLAQPSVRREAKENFTGTAGQARVPVSFLENLELPLPPLAEQRRIVAKLEQVLGKVELCQRRLAKIPVLLKRFRQAVLAAACSGRLTADWREENDPIAETSGTVETPDGFASLPETWRWQLLETVCEKVVDCPHSTPKWTQSGCLCVRTTNIKPGFLDLSEVRYVSRAAFEERIERLRPKAGDVLYSREGGILGIACMIPPRAELCLGQRMMMFRVKQGFTAVMLMHWLNSSVILSRVKDLTGGSASPHLNVRDIKAFPIPVPPLPEQQEIVRRVEALFALADKIEARYAKAQAKVDRLTPSLLARAFAGKLVPQDPADEPAAVLLERIRGRNGPAASADPTKITAYPEAEPRELKVAEPSPKPRRR